MPTTVTRAAPSGSPLGFRLRHQQAGARILLQILRVHSHGADEEEGPSLTVQGIGHQRPERKARPLARKGGEAADAAQMQQRTRPLRERWLGNGRLSGRRPCTRVLVARHGAPCEEV